MDLTTLDTRKAASDGAELSLKHPVTKLPIGAVIKLHGTDSEIFHAARREMRARINAKRVADPAYVRSDEEEKDDNIGLLAAVTSDWRGMEEGPETIPFSEANARRLYKKYPWMEEQVNAFIQERGNFLI